MSREVHVRFCEGLGVRFPRATHPTIEGLQGSEAEALKTAWTALDVVQCGYCQSGQLMNASALLMKKANPSDADIDAAMAGNICRCGTYPRIRAAIHQAAGKKGA